MVKSDIAKVSGIYYVLMSRLLIVANNAFNANNKGMRQLLGSQEFGTGDVV